MSSIASLLETIRRQPGIDAAGATTAAAAGPRLAVAVRDRRSPGAGGSDDRPIAQHVCDQQRLLRDGPGTLLAGRSFTTAIADGDRAGRRRQPDLRESNVSRERTRSDDGSFRPRRNIGPLGQNLLEAGPFRIVGIVADIHQAPLDQTGEPVIYHSARQFPFRAMTIVARGSDEATAIAAMRSRPTRAGSVVAAQ